MSVKYEVLKKLVVAAGLKKRWLSATTEELLENRRKQNAKNRIPALKDDAFEFGQGESVPDRRRHDQRAKTCVC